MGSPEMKNSGRKLSVRVRLKAQRRLANDWDSLTADFITCVIHMHRAKPKSASLRFRIVFNRLKFSDNFPPGPRPLSRTTFFIDAKPADHDEGRCQHVNIAVPRSKASKYAARYKVAPHEYIWLAGLSLCTLNQVFLFVGKVGHDISAEVG